MSRRLVLAAATLALVGTVACQPTYFGASNLALSDHHVDYNGPVYANSGYTPAQGAAVVRAHVAEQTGAIVIADYEHNGIRDGVWGTDDHNGYWSMVFADERCTVVVKGWRYDHLQDELRGARADIDRIVSERRGLGYPTVVVDLQGVLTPADVSHDGVHLTTADAARRYGRALMDGAASC